MQTSTIIIIAVTALGILRLRSISYRRNHPWIFKKKVLDEKLGRLWFNKVKRNPEYNHFQGHAFFKPTNKAIDIYFDSEEAILDLNQVKLYHEIEKKYNELFSQYFNSLKSADRDNIFEYKLFAISIEKFSSLKKTFKLVFRNSKDLENNLTLTFSNWDIIKIEQ